MLQSTFQTVQLTASAEIDTYNPQIYVIEENTVTVSASRSLSEGRGVCDSHSISEHLEEGFFSPACM